MLVTKLFDAFDLAIPVVGQVKRRQLGDGNFIQIGLRGLVRDGEQDRRDALLCFPNAFHRGQFGGLVFQSVEAVQVADHDLQRNQGCSHHHTGAQRGHHV